MMEALPPKFYQDQIEDVANTGTASAVRWGKAKARLEATASTSWAKHCKGENEQAKKSHEVPRSADCLEQDGPVSLYRCNQRFQGKLVNTHLRNIQRGIGTKKNTDTA